MPNLKISQFTNLAGAQTPSAILPLVVGAAPPNYYSTLNDLFADLSKNTTTGAIAISNAALTVDGDAALDVNGLINAPANAYIIGGDFTVFTASGTAAGSNGYSIALAGTAVLNATANLVDNIIGVVGQAEYIALSGGTLTRAIGVEAGIVTNGAVTIATGICFHATNALNTVGGVTLTQYGLYVDALTSASNNYAIKTNAGLVALGDHTIIGGQATASEMRLLEPSGSGTNYTGFKAPALSADLIYTLPPAQASGVNVLINDGAGVLSWGGVPAPGSDGQIIYNDHGSLAGAPNAIYSTTSNSVTVTANSDSVHALLVKAAANNTLAALVARSGLGATTASIVEFQNQAGGVFFKVRADGRTEVTSPSLTNQPALYVGRSGASDDFGVIQVNATSGPSNISFLGALRSWTINCGTSGSFTDAFFIRNTGSGGGTAFTIDASNNIYLNGTSTTLSSNVVIGGGATASEMRLLEPSGSGTNYTGFKAPALAADVIYTLPAADGTSGQVLSTNGSKTLSWVTVSASVNWDAIGNPTANQSLNLSTFTTTWTVNDSATSAITQFFTIGHNSSGTPATGYGTGIKFQLQSSTTTNQDAASLNVSWLTATHATRSSAVTLQTIGQASALLNLLTVGHAPGFSTFQNIWFGAGTPSSTNYSIQVNDIGGELDFNGSTVRVRISTTNKMSFFSSFNQSHQQTYIDSASAGTQALIVRSAASPTVDIAQFQVSTTTKFAITKDGVQQNLVTTTGAGSAALGANCPAVTVTAPFEWVQVKLSDNSTGYFPVWK